MLTSALIVFREVLEAALIVTIIMAATRQVKGRGLWVGFGICAGVTGSVATALLANTITSMFDGVGQEIMNASILFLAVGLINWHLVWMNSHGRKIATDMRNISLDVVAGNKHMRILAIVIGLAVLREGSEIVLMLQGIGAGEAQSMVSLYGGAILGLMAGIVISGLMYLGFLALPIGRVFALTNGFLILIAAGMAARGANFLVQAGLVSVLSHRVWDTSSIISEQSMIGQFLTALTGYIANPNGLEILFYTATILVVLILMTQARRSVVRS